MALGISGGDSNTPGQALPGAIRALVFYIVAPVNGPTLKGEFSCDHGIVLRELPTRSDRQRFRDPGQQGIFERCWRRPAPTVQLTDAVLHLSRVRPGPALPKDGLMVRPQYLEDHGVPPPSQTQQDRSTVEYRCYRLIGLSNLYYWAMSWCVHAANDWKLGEPASSFILRQPELSNLGLKTLMEVAKCGFVYGDFRINVRQRDQTMREGEFVLSSIHWGQALRYLNVTAETGDDADSEPPEFIGDDLVLAIEPPQRPECVPMALICTRLRGAYVNAAANLREAGITWTEPPFFNGFESWEELAKNMEVRGTDPKVVLQDLEEQRKQVVANVEHVLMVNVQDEHEDDFDITISEVMVIVNHLTLPIAEQTIKNKKLLPESTRKKGREKAYSYRKTRELWQQRQPTDCQLPPLWKAKSILKPRLDDMESR